MRGPLRARSVFPVLGGLLLLAAGAGMAIGRTPIGPVDIARTFLGHGSGLQETVLLHLRLPRVALAVLVGAGMAVSGAILQGVVRNVLADPGLLGINAGAGLAAAVYVAARSIQDDRVLVGTSLGSVLALPIFALTGAGLAAALVYSLARRRGVTPWRLVLVGIAVSHGLAAVTVVLLTRLTKNQVAYAKIWLTGSIWAANWTFVLVVTPMLFVLGALALRRARLLDVLGLGDAMATGLGLRVERERRLLLALAAGLAGSCVAVAGTIGFLGLIAPHIARRLVGPGHRALLPAAALVGSVTLCLADVLGHNLLAPRDIPAGVMVAAIGAPYFLYLLARTGR